MRYAHAVERAPSSADRQVGRTRSARRRVSCALAGEGLHPAVAFELKPHAGGAPAVRLRPRPDEERQVEARRRRASVEIEPFGPRVRPAGRIGNRDGSGRSGAAACPAWRPSTRCRPACLATRRRPWSRVAERALEARNAAAGRRREWPCRPATDTASVVCDGAAARTRGAQRVGLQRARQHQPRRHLLRRRMSTSPPPTSAGACACSSTMPATPSRIAITPTPTPKPAARTALRTGWAVSERSASGRSSASPRSRCGRRAWSERGGRGRRARGRG